MVTKLLLYNHNYPNRTTFLFLWFTEPSLIAKAFVTKACWPPLNWEPFKRSSGQLSVWFQQHNRSLTSKAVLANEKAPGSPHRRGSRLFSRRPARHRSHPAQLFPVAFPSYASPRNRDPGPRLTKARTRPPSPARLPAAVGATPVLHWIASKAPALDWTPRPSIRAPLPLCGNPPNRSVPVRGRVPTAAATTSARVGAWASPGRKRLWSPRQREQAAGTRRGPLSRRESRRRRPSPRLAGLTFAVVAGSDVTAESLAGSGSGRWLLRR